MKILGFVLLACEMPHNFEGLAWVSNDMCYQRKAARCRDLHWSRVDSALYHDAFTGRAWSVPRCSLCLSTHHSLGQCAFASAGSLQVGGQPSTGMSFTPSSSGSNGGGGQWCGLYNRMLVVFATADSRIIATTVW